MFYLTGVGHFGVGFLIGWLLMLFISFAFRKNLSVQLYTPFLPFLIGFLAVAPYVFLVRESCTFSPVINFFVFYSWIHCEEAFRWLTNLHLVALICGGIYCLIIWRYIRLVKQVRRSGWK